MTKFNGITLLAVSLLTASCDVEQGTEPLVPETPKSYQSSGWTWTEQDYTTWMSRAELQFLQESNTEGDYFAHVEGRNNGGRIEYRAVVRPFPADHYQQWAVFWGIEEPELFDWELRLLRAGFVRKSMQVFTDSAGVALHQIVWLQPSGTPGTFEPVTMLPSRQETAESLVETQATSIQPAPEAPAPAPADELVEASPAESSDPAPVEEPEPDAEVADVDAPEEVVPAAEAAPAAIAVEEEPTRDLAEEQRDEKAVHTVVPGDTLSGIARKRGVTVAALKKANRLRSDILRIGQKIVIP